MTYNVAGGEAGNKQYSVDKNGCLLTWESGEPVAEDFTFDKLSGATFLTAQEAGLCREGYLFAGWSFEPKDSRAAEMLAEVYPVSPEQTALWLREQSTERLRQGVRAAFKNGKRQMTLYAMWIAV